MANEAHKIKLLVLWDILCKNTDENHALNTDELSELLALRGLNVSRKILVQDIATLCDNGYEVLSYKKKYHYYYVVNRSLETAEVVMLADVINASKLPVAQKKALVGRLAETLCTHQAESISKHIISLDKGRKGSSSFIYNVDAIEHAINENKQISFLYHTATGDWEQGRYGFESQEKAENWRKNEYGSEKPKIEYIKINVANDAFIKKSGVGSVFKMPTSGEYAGFTYRKEITVFICDEIHDKVIDVFKTTAGGYSEAYKSIVVEKKRTATPNKYLNEAEELYFNYAKKYAAVLQSLLSGFNGNNEKEKIGYLIRHNATYGLGDIQWVKWLHNL